MPKMAKASYNMSLFDDTAKYLWRVPYSYSSCVGESVVVGTHDFVIEL